jgi:hypothetical protein
MPARRRLFSGLEMIAELLPQKHFVEIKQRGVFRFDRG